MSLRSIFKRFALFSFANGFCYQSRYWEPFRLVINRQTSFDLRRADRTCGRLCSLQLLTKFIERNPKSTLVSHRDWKSFNRHNKIDVWNDFTCFSVRSDRQISSRINNVMNNVHEFEKVSAVGDRLALWICNEEFVAVILSSNSRNFVELWTQNKLKRRLWRNFVSKRVSFPLIKTPAKAAVRCWKTKILPSISGWLGSWFHFERVLNSEKFISVPTSYFSFGRCQRRMCFSRISFESRQCRVNKNISWYTNSERLAESVNWFRR